jgi:hypothetical protein
LLCIFSLSRVTAFIKCSHPLTILPTLALSPGCFRGSISPRSSMPTLGCRYFVHSASLDCVGYC